MRKLLLICLFGLSFNASASEAQPIDHFVFLIHGLGGNIESFGSMEKALTQHLNESGELGNVAVESFEYKTFNRLNKSKDFSIQFSNFINTTTSGWSEGKYTAHPDYKISIVAHSQGGLITTMMFYDSMRGAPHFNPEIHKRLVNVVTLGTPFWGSKIASIIERPVAGFFFNLMSKKVVSDKGEVGADQISQLALGSEVVQEFRRNLMKMTPADVDVIHKNLRVLNVAGNANLKRISSEDTTMLKETSGWFKEKWQNFLTNRLKNAFGLKEYEADMLVSLPASTMNTLTLKKLDTGYEHGEVTHAQEFSEYDSAERLFVRTVHASPKAEELYDIVYTPKVCLTDENCNHPTYKYVLNYLRGKSLQDMKSEMGDLNDGAELGLPNTMAKDNVRMENFGGFTIAVNVRYPKGYEHLRNDTYVSMEPYSPHLLLNMDEEIMSQTRFRGSEKFTDSMVEWQTGHFKYSVFEKSNKEWRKWGGTVLVKVTGPAMKTRIIYAPVKPTLSTFIDVQLERMTEEEMDRFIYKR